MTSRLTGAHAPSLPKPRQPQTLNPRLDKRLLAYATMGGAAAAGFAAPAEAEVVYTPIHANLNHAYYLDLNNDGINDFTLSSAKIGDASTYLLKVLPGRGNRIAGAVVSCFTQYVNAAAFAAGVEIGVHEVYFPKIFAATCMGIGFGHIQYGPWGGEEEHYLGLAFYIDGQLHYGWARLSVNDVPCDGCLGKIEGYAYETVPNRPITTGDEGSTPTALKKSDTLGGLAVGWK